MGGHTTDKVDYGVGQGTKAKDRDQMAQALQAGCDQNLF